MLLTKPTARQLHRSSVLLSKGGGKSTLNQRLQDLHDQNTVDDNDPLVQIQKRLDKDEFVNKYRKEIEFVKVSKIANKEVRDTSLAEPWDGNEALHDTSLRMILDKVGSEKNKNDAIHSNTAFKSKTLDLSTLKKRPVSKQQRLETAQDRVLDYKMNKNVDEKEASKFRKLYAEKFTPIGSFEKIKSIADARIEESMRNNGFAGLEKLRGKKIDMQISNPYVDRTEHHLNSMLVQQNIVPPWIEKQSSVNSQIQAMRHSSIHSFKVSLERAFRKDPHVNEDFKRMVFNEWKTINGVMVDSKITSANSSLRSYNLQAPLSTQKFYLQPEKEYNRIYDAVDINKEYALHQTSLAKPSPSTPQKRGLFSDFFKLW